MNHWLHENFEHNINGNFDYKLGQVFPKTSKLGKTNNQTNLSPLFSVLSFEYLEIS